MWSQPYDLNLYRAYSGVGVAREGFANFSEGVFNSMYYDTGNWVRRPAGEESRYVMEGLEVVTNITQNTYKPVLIWTIQEVLQLN